MDVHPYAQEHCDNIDEDCDGLVDNEGVRVAFVDEDGDGFGGGLQIQTGCELQLGLTETSGDCDDGDATVFPAAAALCDGRDHDCDGAIDNDMDGDGAADALCGGSDCDDQDAEVVDMCGYFVAADGDDTLDGRTPSRAWRTLSRVGDAALVPGDQVHLHRGDVFRDTLILSASGEPGTPIVFDSYGEGAPPFISGADPISGWTSIGPNVQAAPTSEAPSHLFVNGVRMQEARYPNDWARLAVAAVNNGDGSMTLVPEAGFAPPGVVVGAELLIRTINWRIETTVVESWDPAAGELVVRPALLSTAGAGSGFYLMGAADFIDRPGEWGYDQGSGQVRLFPPNGTQLATADVLGAVRANAIRGEGVHDVEIRGLSLAHTGNEGLVVADATNLTLQGIQVHQPGSMGIVALSLRGEPGRPSLIADCTVSDAPHDGIVIGRNGRVAPMSRDVEVRNSTVSGVGLEGDYGGRVGASGISVSAESGNIHHNTVVDSAYKGISFSGSGNEIAYNVVDGVCMRLTDGGAIYTFGDASYNHVIHHNLVLNGGPGDDGSPQPAATACRGIYLDNFANNIQVSDNAIAFFDGAFRLNTPRNNTLVRNTVFGVRWGFGVSRIHDLFHPQELLERLPVYNNTAYDNEIWVQGDGYVLSESSERADLDFLVLERNAFWQPVGGDFLRANRFPQWTPSNNGVSQDFVLSSVGDFEVWTERSTASWPVAYEQILPRNVAVGEVFSHSFELGKEAWIQYGAQPRNPVLTHDGGLGALQLTLDEAQPVTANLVSPEWTAQAGTTYRLEVDVVSDGWSMMTGIVRDMSNSSTPISDKVEVAIPPGVSHQSVEFVPDTNTTQARFLASFSTAPIPATGVMWTDATSWTFDNFHLTEVIPPATQPTEPQLLVNASFEDVLVATPAGWCAEDGQTLLPASVPLPPLGVRVVTPCGCNEDGMCNNLEDASSCPRDCAP